MEWTTSKKIPLWMSLRDSGGIPSQTFKDKLVLVGITDRAIGSSFVTPVDSAYQFNGIILSSLRNIWEGNFLSRPLWAPRVGIRVVGGCRIVCDLSLPRIKAKKALLVTLGVAVLTSGRGLVFVLGQELVDQNLLSPLAVLFLAYFVVTVRRFFFTEMRKELVEAQSIETNKSLGLSYQTQGLLDMAFEKLRKCPVDSDMKGVLYNLALDFERKRQFGKAGVVYDHMAWWMENLRTSRKGPKR
jgi:hypothetical protein